MKRLLFVFIALLLFSSGALAVLQQSSIKIFAVTSEGQGLSADLRLIIEPGNGKIWSSVKPLVGTTTQNAERTAIEAAKIYAADAGSYDYKFEIESNASVVEGPSAGAAMTLLAVSMLRNRSVPENVSLTGTIANDGSIGPVGGVFEKAQEASRQGIKLFLVPKGEAKQIVKLPSGVQSVNLIDYAQSQWGLKIVEVETMDRVLELAFSDISTIDINKQADENAFDFLPEPIQPAQSLSLMRSITEKQVQEGKKQVESAKKSLNSSLLEDSELVQLLLGLLNGSEENLKEAELLLDRNFLYSAANYAFLAKVNAMLVQDIAENPSLLSFSSTLFHSRLLDLKKRIQALETGLDETIPLDYLEWHIAAQQRAVYAENNVNDLLSNQTIVINVDNSGKTDYTTVLQRIQDYEFAEAWFGIANGFFELTKNSKRRMKPDNAFSGQVDKLIVQIENSLTVLPKEDTEEIERRYSAAVREKALGWDLAAVFDTASAIALVNSLNAGKESDLNKLHSMLQETNSRIRKTIEGSSNPFVWANLYLDHANYFLSGVDYYISSNREAKALEAAKSGVSISMLADNLLKASSELYSHYNSIPEDRIIKVDNPPVIPGINERMDVTMFLLVLAAGLIVGCVFALLAIKLLQKASKKKNSGLQEQQRQVINMQKELDGALAKGDISNEQYYRLQEKYTERLNFIQGELKEKSEHVLSIDSLRARLVGFEHVLRSLKQHFEAGLILAEDYKKQVELIQKEINSIKKEIESQSSELLAEEQQIKKQSVADLKQETEKIEKEEKKTKKAKKPAKPKKEK